MSAEMLSAVAGIMLSLVFSYVPGVSDWFAALDGTRKRLVMLAALVIAAAGVAGLSCLGLGTIGGTPLPGCDQAGLLALGEALVVALVANQAAYLITPKPGEGQAA